MEQTERWKSVDITDQLQFRATPSPDYLKEKLALQDLARQMADAPADVLPRLVNLAMTICDASSAGISILESESEQFRWNSLHGVLAAFESATTPRNFSPCGICLDLKRPVLMEKPERVYDWIAAANIVVPEVLLVPLMVGQENLGTLWIVASEGRQFDSEHTRIMTELAAFAGIALKMITAEERLQKALGEQQNLALEMGHRVKNVFAIVDGLIRTSGRGAMTQDEFAESLTGRLRALSEADALVRRSFSGSEDSGVDLEDVVRRILIPYSSSIDVDGPKVALGVRATNNIALALHEFATNSVKYGALKDSGSISIKWTAADTLAIVWTERGGPKVSEPAKFGFGSTMVKAALASHGGAAHYEWRPDGVEITMTMPMSSLAR